MTRDERNGESLFYRFPALDVRRMWLASLGGCALLMSGAVETLARIVAGVRRERIVSTD